MVVLTPDSFKPFSPYSEDMLIDFATEQEKLKGSPGSAAIKNRNLHWHQEEWIGCLVPFGQSCQKLTVKQMRVFDDN